MKTLLAIILFTISFTSQADHRDIFTEQERESISDYLDNICPDTYCGGDINWTSPKLVCGKNYCSVIINAASYYANDPFFSVEEFDQSSAQSKKGQGFKLLSADSFSDSYYDYDTDIESYVTNTKVTAWCRLELPENISGMTYNEKEDAVYYANLDCVDKIEAAIYGL